MTEEKFIGYLYRERDHNKITRTERICLRVKRDLIDIEDMHYKWTHLLNANQVYTDPHTYIEDVVFFIELSIVQQMDTVMEDVLRLLNTYCRENNLTYQLISEVLPLRK